MSRLVRRQVLVPGAVLAVVLLGAGTATFLVTHRPTAASCTVVGGGTTYAFTAEQMANAATIAAVGERDGMPDHAVTVALATALQESKLVNLPGGDRDSAGLFQQRPSQGWGTLAQVTTPAYAAEAFYAALRKQPGWQTLAVTQAAQQVQRSAAPEAYAQWEPRARAAAAALTGETPAALTCRHVVAVASPPPVASVASEELGMASLPGAQTSSRGWSLASWLVSHAESLAVTSVTYDGRTWSTSDAAWSTTGPADGVLSYVTA